MANCLNTRLQILNFGGALNRLFMTDTENEVLLTCN